MQVSYSVTTQSADDYFKFYRTLPSDIFVNYGRLSLVIRFDWFRIGILHSTEEEHVSVSSTDMHQVRLLVSRPHPCALYITHTALLSVL